MNGRPPVVVLHVLEALEGGTARHLTDVVTHVTGAVHHVVVPERRVGGVTDARAVPAMEAAGATVHRLAMRRLPVHPRNLAALAALRRLVRRIGPDVVHGHSAVGGALARLAAAGRPALRVYTPNGLHPAPAARIVEQSLGPLTDRLVAVSPSEARVAAARRLVPESRIVVIPTGVAPDVAPDVPPDDGTDEGKGAGPPAIDLRHLLGLGEGAPLVGFVGRLVPQKNPEAVVEAAALVHAVRPDVRVLMIGSGPRDEAVRTLVAERHLGSVVHVLPHVPGAASLMGQLDVLVLPSLYEGCPYAALEAMRAGTPVVLSDAVGNRDLVTDGVTGRLVRTGDDRALAEALLDVFADPERSARMAEAARRHVAEHHDLDRSAAALAALYSETAPRSRAGAPGGT